MGLAVLCPFYLVAGACDENPLVAGGLRLVLLFHPILARPACGLVLAGLYISEKQRILLQALSAVAMTLTVHRG